MSIQYCEGSMPKEFEPLKDAYLCLFPSIGLKKCGQYENYLSEVYGRYPHTDYYKQHASTGKRGKPGEFVVYPPKGDAPGIINMNIRVYPGNKAYPNDNSFLRIKNFGQIFNRLAERKGISALHVMIPSKVEGEQAEYIQHLEDYVATAKLHNNNVTVNVYGTSGPIIRPQVQAVGAGSRTRVKVSPHVRRPGAPAPSSKDVSYKLKFQPEQILDVVLYDEDYVQGTVVNTELAHRAASDLGILTYLDDPEGRWSRLLDDTKLRQEACKVQTKIGQCINSEDIFPPKEDMFNALTYLQPGTEPKVVIIGQDPYHKPGEAHGLSFSVKNGVTVPPSLRNVYAALENDPDVDFKRPKHGCLEGWAQQGVILLNAALTVKRATPKSHSDIWLGFTDRLIQLLAQWYPDLIFVLWGGDAKKKRGLITGKHAILEYNHPSPMVRNNKFATECRHFSQINGLLSKQGKQPIQWQLDD